MCFVLLDLILKEFIHRHILTLQHFTVLVCHKLDYFRISVRLSNKAGSSETAVLSEGVLHVNKSEIIKCKFCEQTVQWSSSGLCAFTTLFSMLMSVRARQH